jgi:DNA mismatch endonuclease (patch repair protein)
MRRQRRTNTTPEVTIRRLLHHEGFRFRIHVKLPALNRRTMDIAFTRLRVAVFIDGCYWHGCPDHRTWPTANAVWWRAKLEGNVRRDRETDAHLLVQGWLVVRIWEHEDPAEAVLSLAKLLRERRDQLDRIGSDAGSKPRTSRAPR